MSCGQWIDAQIVESCHKLVTETEPAGQPISSGKKNKNVLAQAEPSCTFIYCISVGACLPERQGKFSNPKPATLVAFPFPSQKGGVITKKNVMPTVCGVSLPCDLGEPLQVSATKEVSKKPTCIR